MREKHPKHKAILVTDDVNKHVNLSLARKHAYFLESGTSAVSRGKQLQKRFHWAGKASKGAEALRKGARI